ncbi:MAG: phosphonate metabolism transcriptional regulator PhnF [Acetobacteraceae bacterium]
MTGAEAQPPLRRHDGVALWRQIASGLKQEISTGVYAPGSRLPTEQEFSRRFGVNRHTVRRALEALSHDGLIRVEQGRGAFVAEDVLEYAVESRTRFSEWIRRHNKEPSGRVLRLAEIAADSRVAAALQIRPGARVVMLERLGLADSRPVSIATHYFPAARLRGVMEALKREPTITAALKAVGVADYMRQITRVSARLPSADEAELLRTSRSRPVLETENINVDDEGAVVEFGVARYPTPRVQIVFEP